MILAIEGHARSKKARDSGGPVDMDISAVNKEKGQSKGKGNGKKEAMSKRTMRIRSRTASVSCVAKLDTLPKFVVTEFVQ